MPLTPQIRKLPEISAAGPRSFAENIDSFTFAYLNGNGSVTTVSADVRRISITITGRTARVRRQDVSAYIRRRSEKLRSGGRVMMQTKRYPRTSLCDEKGMVLVVGLLLVAVLMLLGTTAVMTSTTDIKISTNYKTGNQAFYAAEAGVEEARARMKADANPISLRTHTRRSLNGGPISERKAKRRVKDTTAATPCTCGWRVSSPLWTIR